MARLIKHLTFIGLASVYLMAQPCTFAEHGFNLGIPNFGLPALLNNLLKGFGT